MKMTTFLASATINARLRKQLLSNGTLIAVALPVCLALPCPSALAVDGKDYPGGLCRPLNNSDAYTINAFGDILNPNTFQMTVHCPGVHDEGNRVSGQVNFVDLSTLTDVRCILKTRSRKGVILGSQTQEMRGVFSSQTLTLEFSAVQTAPDAIHFYECTIPGTQAGRLSRITSFELTDQ